MTAQSRGDGLGSRPRAPLQSSLEKDLERLDDESSTCVAEATEPTPRRSNVVDWDGPCDPQNPLNWPLSGKASVLAVVSTITFLSPLASSIFAPGIPEVMSDFKSTNEELASFIVSVYIVGYCFGPLVIAPLSEIYGRAPLYNTCNVAFIVFSVACAVAPNLGALIVFRLLACLAGSCPMALGPGTVADLVTREQRGRVMAAWVSGTLLGPVVGPIAGGGYLTGAKGWRWSFWVVAIAGGIFMLTSFVVMRETYAYAILDRKIKRLRKETGNEALRSCLDEGRSAKDVFTTAIVRPSRMLIFSPIVFLLSVHMCILYGYLYLIFTALPSLFQHEYGFSTGQVGLTYLGIGVGSVLGLVISGAASDRLVASLRRKHGGEFKPEYRLPLLVFAGSAVPVALFLFGWTVQARSHWILPIIGTSTLGLGVTLAFVSSSWGLGVNAKDADRLPDVVVDMVDAFGVFAASAVAASTVIRSLGGTALPLAGGKMFATLGFGWGSSLLAFIALVMIPAPLALYRYGELIRRKNLWGVEF